MGLFDKGPRPEPQLDLVLFALKRHLKGFLWDDAPGMLGSVYELVARFGKDAVIAELGAPTALKMKALYDDLKALIETHTADVPGLPPVEIPDLPLD